MYEPLIYISIVFSLIYLVNILRFIVGLIKKTNIIVNDKTIPVSIIIAVKNGEKNLEQMMDRLLNQTYLGEMEFIMIDDESIDQSKQIIQNYSLKDSRFQYVSSDQGASYLKHKKKAIDAGIKAASHEHLLFTDIDCIIQYTWVESMVKYFSKNVDYIVGHSYVNDRKSILNKFQKIDLLMLLFAAKSTISLNTPWASTGQNQGYKKNIYNQLNGFKDLASYLQGDDTLFLQLAVKNGAKVIFNDQIDSYVISRTELNWKSLLLQRGRWAGDANVMWKFNRLFYLAATSLFIMSASMIGLIFSTYSYILILLLLLKGILELFLYILGMNRFQHPIKYVDFMIWFIIHPIYVLIMGIFSFMNFQWKGKSI